MYIKRHVEETIGRLAEMFSSVVVTGPRQVGKTTMLKEKYNGMKYITFDNYGTLNSARENPSVFFDIYSPPLIMDEIQYCPQILHGVKLLCDERKEKGLFFMTGSQSFHLMKDISESLAGRIGVVEMLGLSLREIMNVGYHVPFLATDRHIATMNKIGSVPEYWEIWNRIQRGSCPEIVTDFDNDRQWFDYYNSYLKTYIERDIKAIINIQDESAFVKFIKVVASLTGQLLNYNTIAQACGKDVNTVTRWLSMLVSSNMVYLLQPYYSNLNKRLLKTPKLYFLDTGLACFLTGWYTKEQLANGAMGGHLFETFVVAEILKSYCNDGVAEAPLYYYRDKDKNEIDIVIEAGDELYPIEIKSKSNPEKNDIKSFRKLDMFTDKKRVRGCCICTCKQVDLIDRETIMLPVGYI